MKKIKNILLKIKKFLWNYRNIGIFCGAFTCLILSSALTDVSVAKNLTFFIFDIIFLLLICLPICLLPKKIRSIFLIVVLIFGYLFVRSEKNVSVLKETWSQKIPYEKIPNNQYVISKKVTAYVLNLDRAKERWEFVRPQIEQIGIPYERVSAVEGKLISDQTWKNLVDEETFCEFFKMLPEKGTIGCSLSHEKTWRTFLASDSEFALIFEDDVQFDPKVLYDVVLDLISKKDLWDIVSFELNHHGCPLKISKLPHEKSLVFYMTNVKHSGAYLINRAAAQKLLKRFFPIKMPVDHYFTRSWEFDFKFCGVELRIVEQRFGDSQIKCDPSKRKTNAKIITINALYNVYTAFMGTIYNFILWLSSK